jgi:hypothetical protein
MPSLTYTEVSNFRVIQVCSKKCGWFLKPPMDTGRGEFYRYHMEQGLAICPKCGEDKAYPRGRYEYTYKNGFFGGKLLGVEFLPKGSGDTDIVGLHRT